MIDIIVKKLSEKKLINLYKKLDKIDTDFKKYNKIKFLIKYLKARSWIEIYSRDEIIKEY